MANAAIIFSFPEPETNQEMGTLVQAAKLLFRDVEDVKIYLAVNDAADSILNVLGVLESEEKDA